MGDLPCLGKNHKKLFFCKSIIDGFCVIIRQTILKIISLKKPKQFIRLNIIGILTIEKIS